jgi:hypothetical protein
MGVCRPVPDINGSRRECGGDRRTHRTAVALSILLGRRSVEGLSFHHHEQFILKHLIYFWNPRRGRSRPSMSGGFVFAQDDAMRLLRRVPEQTRRHVGAGQLERFSGSITVGFEGSLRRRCTGQRGDCVPSFAVTLHRFWFLSKAVRNSAPRSCGFAAVGHSDRPRHIKIPLQAPFSPSGTNASPIVYSLLRLPRVVSVESLLPRSVRHVFFLGAASSFLGRIASSRDEHRPEASFVLPANVIGTRIVFICKHLCDASSRIGGCKCFPLIDDILKP